MAAVSGELRGGAGRAARRAAGGVQGALVAPAGRLDLGALGGLELGWAEVDARLDWVSEPGPRDRPPGREPPDHGRHGLALTVDLERMRRLVDGQAVPRVLRATQVYRLEDGEWKTSPPRRRAAASRSLQLAASSATRRGVRGVNLLSPHP